jgi:hypothetical protein
METPWESPHNRRLLTSRWSGRIRDAEYTCELPAPSAKRDVFWLPRLIGVLVHTVCRNVVALAIIPLMTANTAAAEPLAQQCGSSPCSSPISGIVYWSDGQPASSITIDLMPSGPGDLWGWTYDYVGANYQVQTDSNGQYQAAACPCSSLMGFVIVGGNVNCQIIMGAITPTTTRADFSSYRAFNGVRADPGENINWMVTPSHCNQFAIGVQPGNVTRSWFQNINSREAAQQGDSPLSWQQTRQWFNSQGG